MITNLFYSLFYSCYFRFPSTEIRIQFESFLHTDSPSSVVGGGVNNLSSNSLNNHHHNISSSSSASSHHLLSGHGGSVGNVHQVIISPASAEELHQQQLHGQHGQQMQHMSSSQQHGGSSGGSHLLPMDNSNVIYSPLKISIPKKEQKSPYLSPTGKSLFYTFINIKGFRIFVFVIYSYLFLKTIILFNFVKLDIN